MRFVRIILLPLLCSVYIVFPGLSFAEVKLSLKNGREIIADRCRDSNGKLRCESTGGYFEVEKKDVRDVKSITIKQKNIYENPPQEAVPEPEGRKGDEGKAAEERASEKQGGELLVRGLNPEVEKRLDEINKRKLELSEERERLSREREQLHKDVKEMGMIHTKEQFDSINRRISDVEGRIDRFNEEVKQLNEEEDRITGELKKEK
ncbi:MAG: hypothetical protein OEW04_02305 [Nitrospirota bacterium]|nr:hypothetical protein [Nitrospirota bacterium]